MSFSDQPRPVWQKAALTFFGALVFIIGYFLLWMGAFSPIVLGLYVAIVLLLAGYGLVKLFLRDEL